MATYTGMSLSGEVRESVSLDEDDMSDIEDEVFIRDGKNGYKIEDISVKKPLMAPRRKLCKPDVATRLKYRPPCKVLCKPCCYVFAALSVLIGSIILVIVLVSIFPIPIEKFRDWIVNKTLVKSDFTVKPIPCSDLEVSDVWVVNLPKLTSESAIRTVDINQDGNEDIIFGFGSGDDNNIPSNIFCPVFMSVQPPCKGGVMAMDGVNGHTLWTLYFPYSVFGLSCNEDINKDNVSDCLVTGKGGILAVVNSRDGSKFWEFSVDYQKEMAVMDVYSASFIPDQDNDGVKDILASHTSQKNRERLGHLLVISGKSGMELQRAPMPKDIEIYSSPQLFLMQDGNYSVLFGTGSPTSPGNLSLMLLQDLMIGNMSVRTLYEDKYKGILSPAILVDINGDNQTDIISAMFNTTIVAFDGTNFSQIWNYSVPFAETLSVPIPGYFNKDNVTDFLIKYQIGKGFPMYFYSETLIIDGKTGRPIYDKPLIDTVGYQMGGLTLSMEGHGYDWFLFWGADCKGHEGSQDVFEFVSGSTIKQQSNADLCRLRFNSNMVSKMYALNEFDQPPGIEIYTSENRTNLEYNNTISPTDYVRAYLKAHPEFQYPPINRPPLVDDNSDYDQNSDVFRPLKYKDGSSFRHKDNGQGLIRDFNKNKPQEPKQRKYDTDYDQNSDLESDYAAYLDDTDSSNLYSPNNKQLLLNSNPSEGKSRDPRSKKNLADQPKYGIYDYRNVQKARTRLLHDLNNVPTDILKDTYFKNRERLLRKSKFEQRDLKSHEDKIKENMLISEIIDQEKKQTLNQSETLWDLESEKEKSEKEKGLWRGKREVNNTRFGIQKLTSVGVLLKPINRSDNSIDLIFVTYWLPPKNKAQVILDVDLKCVKNKLLNSDIKEEQSFDKEALKTIYMKKCLQERGSPEMPLLYNNRSDDLKDFPYINQISDMNLGQMTVYRMNIKCTCASLKSSEKCARFLDDDQQSWRSYLGMNENGIFNTRN